MMWGTQFLSSEKLKASMTTELKSIKKKSFSSASLDDRVECSSALTFREKYFKGDNL